MAMSDEQKKAASERMKAMHAAKKADKQAAKAAQTEPAPSAPVVPPAPTQETVTNTADDIEELKRQIAELTRTVYAQGMPQPQQGVNIAGGSLVGRVDKYIIDPNYYENPSAKLADEPLLKRFAFDINYELGFTVSSTSYKTLDNINYREPKFTLELYRVAIDEKTGLPTNKRYVVARLVLHEDPEAAIVIARENGLEVEAQNEKDFLNAMRYLRFRDWLIAAFYPKPSDESIQRKEEVVDGKLVEFFIVNSETKQSPFSQINSSTKKL